MPAPRPNRSAAPRTAYHHGDLPASLKREALALIGRHGVDGFSLRRAAQALRVSPSAVYRHYADKAALLAALAEDGFVELAAAFTAAADAAAPPAPGRRPRAAAAARFVAIGRAYVGFALAQPALFAVMFGPHGAGNPAVHGAVRARTRSPYQLLEDALDALVAARLCPPARRVEAAVLAWSSIHGLASLLASGALAATPAAVDAMAAQVAHGVLRACAAPGD